MLHLLSTEEPTNLTKISNIKTLRYCQDMKKYSVKREEFQYLIYTKEYASNDAYFSILKDDLVIIGETLIKISEKEIVDMFLASQMKYDGSICKYKKVVASNSPELTPLQIISTKDIKFVANYFSEKKVLPVLINVKNKYIESICSECEHGSNHDTDYNEGDTNCIHCHKNSSWTHIYKYVLSKKNEIKIQWKIENSPSPYSEDENQTESPESKLRNSLTPIYNLAEMVLLMDKKEGLKEVVMDTAKQVIANRKRIDELLVMIENKK